MAALLPIDTLRRHALPAALAAATPGLAPSQAPVASWHLGHDDRLACRWTVGNAAIPAFTPD
jgi:hypothetical protein